MNEHEFFYTIFLNTRFFWTRIARIKRIIYCTRISRITRILVRSVALTVFEHEIRRRPTDRREVIKRIKRIIFARGSCSVFYTHTDLYLLIAHGSHGSHGSCSRRGAHGFWTLEFSEHEIRRRPTDRREVIKRIARIVFARGSYSVFNTHTDFTLFFICTRISRIARIFVRGETLTRAWTLYFWTRISL